MIEVNNLTRFKINKSFLIKVAKNVLKRENKRKTSVSVALVSEDKIRELNRKYRKKDKATDVLSFPYGEIVICPDYIRKGRPLKFNQELGFVLRHGILHVLGYTHKEMKKKYD